MMQQKDEKANRAGWNKARYMKAGLGLVVLIIAAVAALVILNRDEGTGPSGPVTEVRRGDLRISVMESGALRNRDRVIIANEVEGRTTILWIVDEGEYVEKGDLLVELDSSALEERLLAREISLQNAEAAYVRAEQNLEVTRSQTQSEISAAELSYRFAKLDLEKYLGEDGEYAQQLSRLQADIDIAQEEMLRSEQVHRDSGELAEKGFITALELEGDRLAFQRAQVNLQLARGQLTLLQNYTHDRTLQQLQSDVEQASEQLNRTRMRAHADMVQAKADYQAKKQELAYEKLQLTRLEEQIAKCTLRATSAGMVVYETSANPGRWGTREPLEAGQEVRERQELIYLPASEGMVADISVHESSLDRIRVGMPATVTVPARPGQQFSGTVRRIAPMPDAQSLWMNPDLTVYATQIEVEADNLRTGMSCQVEIIVEELEDVVYVPVQAVVRQGMQHFVYVVNSRRTEARPVQIGLDNNRMVHIREGLEPGEMVLLTPPLPERTEHRQPEATPGETPVQPERAPQPPSGNRGTGGGDRRPQASIGSNTEYAGPSGSRNTVIPGSGLET